MPADPGAALGVQKLPTNPYDIGHVRPSFADPKRFNTLVVRTEYRVSLRLGDVDRLFKHPPSTPLGRMERMQVLGLFYWPLNHRHARTAFDGMPAEPAVNDIMGMQISPAQPAIPGAWEYFKTKIMNGADDAAADDEIRKRLTEWIVQRVSDSSGASVYNESGRTTGGGELPIAAEEGVAATEANGNFAKLRIPGGYCFLTSWQSSSLGFTDDPAYSPWSLGADAYLVETIFRRDNPALGKIPLVALVEKRDPLDNQWKPVKDAWVYFQLLPPDDLPAFDPARPVNAQLNRPPLRASTIGPPAAAAGAGPARLTGTEEGRLAAATAADPQKCNCKSDRGGEHGKGSLTAGTDVAGVIFSTTSLPGFNAAPPGTRTDLSPAPEPYPLAANAHAGGKHLHAVKAQTNSAGEAGVVFTPSRCGGDRYRLRAYVGPTTISGPPGEGASMTAIRVDTGTLVVWRNMRISRYVRQPVTAPAAALLAEVNNATYNLTTDAQYLEKIFVTDSTGANRGLPTADLSTTIDPAKPFGSMPAAWARAFVEMEIDRAARAATPEVLSQSDWQDARTRGIEDAKTVGMGNLGLDLDLDELLHLNTPGINVSTAVVHFPMRTWEAYNAVVPAHQQIIAAAPAGNTGARIARLFWEYLVPGFFRQLANNGYVPGLVMVQGGYGGSWQVWNHIPNNSGWSLEYRGATIWAGSFMYPTAVGVPASNPPWLGYDFTSNCCHELGHAMFRLHGPGADPGRTAGGGHNAGRHDPITGATSSICVMSYKSCEGEFCAKCLFAFRGWNANAIP